MEAFREVRRAQLESVALFLVACAALAFGLTLSGESKWWVVAGSGLLSWAASRRAVLARLSWVWITLLACLPRAVTWTTPPQSSGDLARYAWEARVVLEGASPYAFAPDAPQLASLRERFPVLWSQVEHPSVSAAYPPFAQLTFLAAHGLEALGAETLAALRIVAACGDVAVLIALAALLRVRRREPAAFALWAWSPLVAIEFVGAGHFDAWGIALWIAALAWHESGRAGAAGWLGCAASVKFLPLVVAPFFGHGRTRVKSTVIAAAVLAASFAGFAMLEGGTSGWLRGLRTYGATWESTSALFGFIDAVVRWAPFEGFFDPRWVARAVVAAAWLVCMAVAWRARVDVFTASFVALASFLLLSPTLHPWYVTWIVPFFALRSSRGFEWLSAVAPLLYVVLERSRAGHGWSEPPWLWPAVFGPCLILLAFDARRFQAER